MTNIVQLRLVNTFILFKSITVLNVLFSKCKYSAVTYITQFRVCILILYDRNMFETSHLNLSTLN